MIEKIFGIELSPKDQDDFEHKTVTTKIFETISNNFQGIEDLIVRASEIRRFLG